LTDLCDFCEKGRELKSKLGNIIKEIGFHVGEQLNLHDLKTFIFNAAVRVKSSMNANTNDEIQIELNKLYNSHKSSLELINDYEQIIFHQNVSKIQRLCYTNTLKSIETLTGKIFIELDYKQRMRIGMSPRQVGQEYYNQIMRSCLGEKYKNKLFFVNMRLTNYNYLGFGIYFVQNNEIKEINFNLISSNLEQDGLAAVRGFRKLREQEFFKTVDTKDYIVWSDCGPSFRNQVFLGYLFLELKSQNIKGLKSTQ
jgi:hypothetical protein